jgi:hypothetical protein
VGRGIQQFMGNMGNHNIRRGKPYLSEHQKQIRFFIRLFMVISVLLALAIFVLLNWSNFRPF